MVSVAGYECSYFLHYCLNKAVSASETTRIRETAVVELPSVVVVSVVVEGTVVEGTVVEGTVVEGTVVEGPVAAVDGGSVEVVVDAVGDVVENGLMVCNEIRIL